MTTRARKDHSWMRDPAQWPEHVGGYGHRRAVEGAARKHGRALGVAFLTLCARRLLALDVANDGTRLTPAGAWRLVESWASEGPRASAGKVAA